MTRDQPERDDRSDDRPEGLERAQCREQEPAVLRRVRVQRDLPQRSIRLSVSRTFGRNSSVMVASMGTLPPTPKPLRRVITVHNWEKYGRGWGRTHIMAAKKQMAP
jgi:hypothetical protein